MAYTNPVNPDCQNCNKTGLAILPVRYAVVPLSLPGTLPSPLGNKVSNVAIKHHKYALRTLRAGFFYLFHEKHARGSSITWEIYSVTEAGALWKQPSPTAIKPATPDVVCSRAEHNIPLSVITIESPEKCKRVWIAFSEHIWSKDTLAEFAQDAKLRDRRMQTFLPATWISAGGYRHGLPATQTNIEQVLEYKPGFLAQTLNGGQATPAISNPDGTHFAARLKLQTTRYPATSRSGQSEKLAKAMQEIGENSKGKDHPPIVIAVWDAVGVTHELNGFRNDTAGWVEKYNVERDQQLAAMMAIEGFKQALSKSAGDQVDETQQRLIDQDSAYSNIAKRRANAAGFPPERRMRELEVCDILDDWKVRKVPASAFSLRLTIANEKDEPQRSSEIASLKEEANNFLSKRSSSAARNVETAHSGAWTKYDELLANASNSTKKLYEVFRENYDKFHAAVNKLIDDRTIDLIAWLSSSCLVDALSEFHKANFNDGVVFDDQIGCAIFGINSSESGSLKLDAWVSEIKATDTNLLWRAIALNQSESMREIDDYLQEASRHAKENTPASANSLLAYAQKSLKATADTYKKFANLNASNLDAQSANGAKGFGINLKPVNTRNVDRAIMTVGDKLFKLFGLNSILDRHSEYMIQHLMSIRSLVDPVDSLNLIRSQIRNAPEVRRSTMERLRALRNPSVHATLPAKSPHAEALENGWKNFKETSAKAPGALRDARLSLLIMLIEGVNFSKLMSDCLQKNDAKSWWMLAASSATITSALFDVASVPLKSVLPGKGDSISYQRVKLVGGLLSASATAVTVVLDCAQWGL